MTERPGVPDAHRGRLFRKYLLLILSLVTAVLLLSSGINLYSSYQEHRAALGQLQHEKAIAAASRIEQYVRQISQQLAYAALPQLDAGDVEMRRVEFLKLLRQAPEITDIAWLDVEGKERNAVSRLGMDVTGSGRDRSTESAFVRAKRGQPWYGPVYFRKETEPYMTVAIRPGGDKGPVTVAEVNLKFIWDVVSRIKIGDKGKAYVVDAAGQLVADPDIGLVLRKTSLAALAHVKAASVAGDGDAPAVVSKDLNGTAVLASAAPIAALDWRVFVEQPVAEVYAKLNASILRTGLLLLAGLVISALAASALARSMVRPIRTLDEGARRIGEGELDQQIVIKTGDELEGLADQFNRMTGQLRESYAGLERKVDQRTSELTESLDYQTAISEVLRVISSSTTDVTPVFEAIMDSAVRLFDAPIAAVFRYDGRDVHLAGTRGWSVESLEDSRRLYPAPPNPQMLSGRLILAGQALAEEDVRTDPDYDQTTARVGQWRRMIGAPMLKDGTTLGAVVIAWPDPGKTPQRQTDLLKTFADQAVIAIENVRLISETKEALEQQTATAEILRVISGSITDTQPVFDAIVQSCQRLFGGKGVVLVLPRGAMVETVAFARSGAEEGEGGFLKPWPLDRGSGAGTCILDSQLISVGDLAAGVERFWRIRELGLPAGYHAGLFVPLLRDGKAIGCLAIFRATTGDYDEKQIALARTFADQAVIAIENVRLFNETKEALEQQTATAEVLQVISGSMADAGPVFEKILRSCQRLFASEELGTVLVGDDGQLRLGASLGPTGERRDRDFVRPVVGSATELAIRARRVLHYPDVEAAPDMPATLREFCQRVGVRSLLMAPMLWEDRGVGSIWVARTQPRPYTDKDIALLKTFADQAVIAIQNARLFNETKETLEQQTATAEILKVISASPTDVQPVLDAVAERSGLLCRAEGSRVWLLDGEQLCAMTSYGPGYASDAVPERLPLRRSSVAGRAFLDRACVHVDDVVPLIDTEYPDVRELQAHHRFRTVLAVPMLREGRSVGVISLLRNEVRPFTPSEVSLIQTFADQAVIAIENVRLFSETTEALERQTATAEILQVIGSSVADAAPVFEKILLSCRHLFDSAEQGVLLIGDDGKVRLGAHHGMAQARIEAHFAEPHAAHEFERSIRERRLLYFPDVLAGADVPGGIREAALQMGIGTYSQAFAPMVWEGRAVGSLYVTRKSSVGFSDKELGLLKTFGDQAAIAIQNAHLFNEIQAKSRELEAANRHKSEFLANMSHELRTPLNAIIGFSEVLIERMFGELNEKQDDYLKDIHSSGRHLLSLINDILDLAKIESGRMELDLASFDAAAAMGNAMTLVRERAQRHGLSLSLEAGDVVGEIRADERKFKQILLNLLTNAVKFTPDGGKIAVRARMLDHGIEVAVSDTGIGISKEDRAVVFDEFRQVGRHYTNKQEGTGLGLTLTKRFVELHGGSLRLESVPGQGSTFTFTLPSAS